MKSKKSAIVGAQRDRLIIALEMQDLVGALNLAMRVRKLQFTLDYATDHFPRLMVSMPNVAPEQFMLLDQRKHCCYINVPRNRELFFAVTDIVERLSKHSGRLTLTGDRPRQGPMRALLQIHVEGATKTALTLMDTTKGKVATDTSFQLPDGTTP